MTTKKIVFKKGRDYSYFATAGASLCSCCGCSFDGEPGNNSLWYQLGTPETGLGILVWSTKKEYPVGAKEQLHHINSVNGTFTIALRKN